MRQITSIAFSLTITASLYFGEGSVHQFSFYVIAALTVLGVICLFIASDKFSRSPLQVALSLPTTFLTIAALVMTGYPGWAATYTILSFVLCAVSINNHDKEASE